MVESRVFWLPDPEAPGVSSPFVRQPRYHDLQVEVKELREAMDAMDSMPTGLSPAVCRSMAKYWNGLANRIARESSTSDRPANSGGAKP
jgi:hypothetical protein